MIAERGKQALWTTLGISAGVAAGLWLWNRQTRTEPHVSLGWTPPRGSTVEEVADSLRRDHTLHREPIEVDSIAEGVIELTGQVASREESERAVRLAQGSRGVHTVVNRLTIEEEESHREETRHRREEGAPELIESQHHGMGVGMGTRRQSPATDPDRPSDKQKILDRTLNVANVEEAPEPESELEPVPEPGSDGQGENGTGEVDRE